MRPHTLSLVLARTQKNMTPTEKDKYSVNCGSGVEKKRNQFVTLLLISIIISELQFDLNVRIKSCQRIEFIWSYTVDMFGQDASIKAIKKIKFAINLRYK